MGSVLKNMVDARNKQKIKQIFKNFPMNCGICLLPFCTVIIRI